jgi:hypothetical protein
VHRGADQSPDLTGTMSLSAKIFAAMTAGGHASLAPRFRLGAKLLGPGGKEARP